MSFIFSCFYPCIFSGDFDFFVVFFVKMHVFFLFFLSSTIVALLQVLGLTTLEYIVAA